MIKENIKMLKEKYVDFWDFMMTVAGILEMITDKEFLAEKDVKYYETMIAHIEACHKSQNPKNCIPLCQEFNINKFSHIWDGEKIPIEQFKENYDKYYPKIKDKKTQAAQLTYNKAKYDKLEKAQKEAIKAAKEKGQKKTEKKKPVPRAKVSAKEIKTLKNYSRRMEETAISILDHLKTHKAPKTEKVEGIDNEAEEYRLYKLSPKPLDFTKFTVKVSSLGLDLYADAAANNLATDSKQIIQLIFAKGSEIKPINEKISDDVRSLLEESSVKDIQKFVCDFSIEFDRFMTKTPKKSSIRIRKSILGLKLKRDTA